MFSATRRLLQHKPLIRFIGRRTIPASIDHSPQAHPASPTGSLPDSFATYRQKAQQHGPLGKRNFSAGSGIGGQPGAALGPVEAAHGEFFDRSELPARFARLPWSESEIEAIESGGASLYA